MGLLGSRAGHPRADARNIVQDFVDRVEPIVALEHDEGRVLAREHMVEEIERRVGDRMGVGVGEERPSERLPRAP